MKVKKISNYDLYMLKRADIRDDCEELKSLEIVPMAVIDKNAETPDAAYIFYLCTKTVGNQRGAHKGTAVVTSAKEGECDIVFNDFASDVDIKDVYKTLDKVTEAVITRGYHLVRFAHEGNKKYINAYKKVGYKKSDTDGVVELRSAEEVSVNAALAGVLETL